MLGRAMDARVNEGLVGDTAKLMMHRLVARTIRRDPSLVAAAKDAQAAQARRFEGAPFLAEWDALLALPAGELAGRLVSRDAEMTRLRITSPFYLAEGVDFAGYALRLRIRRAARRIARRGAARSSHGRKA